MAKKVNLTLSIKQIETLIQSCEWAHECAEEYGRVNSSIDPALSKSQLELSHKAQSMSRLLRKIHKENS